MEKHLLRLMTATLLFLASLAAKADGDITVTGTVTDENGEPLIGCTVRLKGTERGCVSDVDGRFQMPAPSGGTLVFSFIGYRQQEAKASARMKVQMQPDKATLLDEVVAVGYGTMKRSDLTGSTVSVKADELTETSAATIDQMLQGKAAGMTVTGNSGAAGSSTSIQIRGVNSLSASNEPIYVIDGVIVRAEAGADIYSNPLAELNPNDIESIEILKDASATAIYGSQAANGVVIVNMKKGKKTGGRNSLKVNFKSQLGWETLPKKLDVMNLREFAQWVNDVNAAAGKEQPETSPFLDPSSLGDGTDWQDAMYRTGLKQEYNLSLLGGTKKVSYSVSGGYFGQEGIVINNSFERFSGRGSIDMKPNDRIDFGGTVSFAHIYKNTGMSAWGVASNALGQMPNIPVRNEDGTWGKAGYDNETSTYQPNPVAIASITTRKNKTDSGRLNAFVNVKPWTWAVWHNEFAMDLGKEDYIYLLPSYDLGGTVRDYATHENATTKKQYYSFSTNVTGKWDLKRVHHITGMAGFEASSRRKDYDWRQSLGGSDIDTSVDSGDPERTDFDKYVTTTRFVSFFGRATYNYADRYLLTMTLRHDGCSLFEKGRRFGTFPSAAFGWRISEEPFFLPLTETVNNLKLRIGYGIVGNANLADNTYLPTFVDLANGLGDYRSYKTANMPNYDGLTWEKTSSWNAGIDLSLFNNRIEFIFDIYLKNIRGLLLQTAQPLFTGTGITGGASAQWANVGNMRNKGFEFTLNAVPVSSKRFKWRTAVTGTMNRNKITKLNNDNGFIDKTLNFSTWNETVTRTAVGHGVSEFYGFKVLGRINSAADFLRDNGDGTSTVTVATPNYRVGTVVNNNAGLETSVGDLLYRDTNGDGIIDDNDRDYIGSPLPKFTFGWNNSFSYKGFSLTLYLYGSVGNKVFNWSRRRMDEPSTISGQMSNKYTRTGNYARIGFLDGNEENGNIWNLYVLAGADDSETRIDNSHGNFNSRVSDRYVEDADFIRLKNIIIAYSFPKKMLRKIHVDGLKLYFNVQNAYTLTGYTGYDPEVGSQNGQYSMSGQGMLMYGVDTGKVPNPRSFIFGLDITL